MAAATAIEKIVLQALVAKGYTPSEAEIVIAKLRETAKFDGTGEIELSQDGNYVAIASVTCMHRSSKKDEKSQGAILVNCKGHEYWIPVTQLAPMSEVTDTGDKGILVIKRWIAEQKKFLINGKPVAMLP